MEGPPLARPLPPLQVAEAQHRARTTTRPFQAARRLLRMTASKQAKAREPTLLSPPLGAAERAAVLAEVAEVATPPVGVAAEAAVLAGAPPLVLAAALLALALRAPLACARTA